jgi:Cdc6-like AAA superfamily ATPase
MKTSSNRLETLIPGLDALLRGGLVLPPSVQASSDGQGLVIMVCGKPGTGKTTLCHGRIIRPFYYKVNGESGFVMSEAVVSSKATIKLG